MTKQKLVLAVIGVALAGCQPNTGAAGGSSAGSSATAAPAPAAAPAAAPATPAWASDLIGKPIDEAFPAKIDGCIGSADNIAMKYDAPVKSVRIDGWAWNTIAKSVFDHLLVVDHSGTIIGAGSTVNERPDVLAARKGEVTALVSGYQVFAPATPGIVSIYGLDASKLAACKIADFQL